MSNWNGKIKCIKGLFTYFTEGKIYEVENGCIIDNDKNLWSNVGRTYKNLNDFHTSNDAGILFEEVKNTPRLCEILGVELNEKFKIKFDDGSISFDNYIINDKGVLLNPTTNLFCRNDILFCLINGDYQIIKQPQYNFTQDEITILKLLSFIGYKYLAKDANGELTAFKYRPYKEGNIFGSLSGEYMGINTGLFKQIKFEDEPLEIKYFVD